MHRVVIPVILILSACADLITEGDVEGRWSAIEIRPDDSTQRIDLSVVKLELYGDDFVYHKSRRDVFKGKFNLDGHLLSLIPQTGPDTAQIQLGVDLIGTDTLLLRMNRNGKETQLVMIRDSL